MFVWWYLGYGRAAAPTTIPNHLGVAKQLRFFQSKILREVLSLSKSAVIDGLIGETGDLSDDWRELKKSSLLHTSSLQRPITPSLEPKSVLLHEQTNASGTKRKSKYTAQSIFWTRHQGFSGDRCPKRVESTHLH